MRMQKLTSFVMMLAFVIATAMPSTSHAVMPHAVTRDVAKTAQHASAISMHDDCAGHHEKQNGSKVAEKKNHSGKTPCCDGKTCKCVGGLCNGLVKIFESKIYSLYSSITAESSFSFEHQLAASAILSRIKRPPRA